MNADEKIIQRMTRLFLKEVSDELTSMEQRELVDWIQVNSENEEWYKRMRTLKFVEEDYRNYMEISPVKQAWECLERDMNRKSGRWRKTWIYSSAAAVVLVLCSVFFLQREKKQQKEIMSSACVHELALISLIIDNSKDSIPLGINKDVEITLAGVRNENNTLIYDTAVSMAEGSEYHTLVVGRGGEYQLTLSDGTVVWLNSESSLKYPVHFSGEQREVELKGEGFFAVRHNETMPFIVKSGDFNVEVLGTSFNIMNYADEQYAQVTLATGKLRVNRRDRYTVILPNQQVQLGETKFEVREVNSRYYTSWIENKFMFDDEPLDVIIRKLARWYNLDYTFKDSTLMKTRFSGQLLKYDDITKAFELLEMTTDVHFSINHETIQIMRKKK